MAALGERFRAAREARGLSLSDVAEQIRIRSVYLGAIEDENWAAIGAPVYTRGFLRTYARFLGLDPEEVVSEFNGGSGSAAPAPSAPGASTSSYSEARPRNLSPLIWIASLVAVALIAFVFYNEVTMRERQAPAAAVLPSNTPAVVSGSDASAATQATSPSPAASSDASPAASAGPAATPGANTLEVRLSQASWVRVAVDGSVSMEGTFPAGTARVFHGKNAVVRIGNAAGVDVLVDGKSVGKLGAAGDVVERSFTL